MNTVDVIVVLVVLLNGIIGAFKGFAWQFIRLGSVILGFVLARSYGPDIANWSESWVDWDPTGRRVIAYVAVFAGAYLAVSLVGHFFRRLIDRARLRSADRSLGFVLGALKGLLFVWIAFYFVLIFFAILPDYAQVQLQGDPEHDIPPSKSFVTWDRWVRGHLDSVMPQEIKLDMEDAQRALGR